MALTEIIIFTIKLSTITNVLIPVIITQGQFGNNELTVIVLLVIILALLIIPY